jgi:penicillin-binding protein 2
MDDPKIAISVYVENSGFGGEWAAPIAALLIEQYLTGEVTSVSRLNRILDADLSDPYPEPEEETADATEGEDPGDNGP